MKMKKFLALGLCAMMAVTTFVSCGSSDSGSGEGPTGDITVVSREEGSGTRGAFVELMGVMDEEENDITTQKAEVTNSTSVMMQTVAGNDAAIGYVSLGSLSDDVKALKVDGVEATVDNVKSGDYKVARPFNIVKGENVSELAQDFEKYIMSEEGQATVAEEGYIREDNTEEYTASGLSGKITLAGSTSVAPVMEVLAEGYKALNPDVEIEIQQTGSGAGIESAIAGTCDLGMSSRALTEDELAQGLTVTEIATDGIAVIVNNNNTIEDLTTDIIGQIFKGEITTWDEVTK